MAGESKQEGKEFFKSVHHFPPVSEELDIEQFLAATKDLISLVERLGSVFRPVKYDMQGNFDKIQRRWAIDPNPCLFKVISNEIENGEPVAAEGVLWLNRALLFFELVFREVLVYLQIKKLDVNMKKIFTVAYEGSVKKYHNWVAQQVFSLICKMSPTLPQVLKSFGCVDNIQEFEVFLLKFQHELHLVRVSIDDYFKSKNMFCGPESQ